MIPNPIRKVLSTLTGHQVRYLLMGGQACVLYGAAEFSRDIDVTLPAAPDNLENLTQALGELAAACIAVPPFTANYLVRGLAVHFRCHHPEVDGVRIDVMALLRGVAPFDELWQRRTTLEFASGERVELMGVADLVQAKKTQRDKDWPMIRKLLEAHFRTYRDRPTPNQVMFWLRQARTAALLMEVGQRFPDPLAQATAERPLLSFIATQDETGLANALEMEEKLEREADRQYWLPLRKELEELRRQRRPPAAAD